MRNILLILPTVLLFLVSCNEERNVVDKQSYDLDNINVKEVKLYANQYSKSLLDQLGIVYQHNFPKASINVNYQNDTSIMEAMLKDSIRLVLLMREPTLYEIDQLKLLHKAKPIYYTFAYSAIALVRDNQTKDTIIDSLQLVNQLTNGEDVFVTTNEYVDLFQLLISKMDIKGTKHPLKVVNNIDELQKYLSSNSNLIGVLPFSLVSDQYDTDSKQITPKFRWLGVQNSKKDTIYPSQSTIFTKEWPFIIPYTILHCNLSNEDGIGFVKYIHSKPATRLIIKAGLIPTTLPDRHIKIEPESFNL